VIFRSPSRSEFQDEKHQWRTHQSEPSEGRKTIQNPKNVACRSSKLNACACACTAASGCENPCVAK
jgi:hypothetical protein